MSCSRRPGTSCVLPGRRVRSGACALAGGRLAPLGAAAPATPCAACQGCQGRCAFSPLLMLPIAVASPPAIWFLTLCSPHAGRRPGRAEAAFFRAAAYLAAGQPQLALRDVKLALAYGPQALAAPQQGNGQRALVVASKGKGGKGEEPAGPPPPVPVPCWAAGLALQGRVQEALGENLPAALSMCKVGGQAGWRPDTAHTCPPYVTAQGWRCALAATFHPNSSCYAWQWGWAGPCA